MSVTKNMPTNATLRASQRPRHAARPGVPGSRLGEPARPKTLALPRAPRLRGLPSPLCGSRPCVGELSSVRAWLFELPGCSRAATGLLPSSAPASLLATARRGIGGALTSGTPAPPLRRQASKDVVGAEERAAALATPFQIRGRRSVSVEWAGGEEVEWDPYLLEPGERPYEDFDDDDGGVGDDFF